MRLPTAKGAAGVGAGELVMVVVALVVLVAVFVYVADDVALEEAVSDGDAVLVTLGVPVTDGDCEEEDVAVSVLEPLRPTESVAVPVGVFEGVSLGLFVVVGVPVTELVDLGVV